MQHLRIVRALAILVVGLALALGSHAQEKAGGDETEQDEFTIAEHAGVMAPTNEVISPEHIDPSVSDVNTVAAVAAVKEGNNLWREGKIAAAATNYQNAIDLQPALYSAQFNLGTAFLRMKKYVEAERLFETALKLEPKSVSAWQGLGFAHYHQKHYVEAIEAFGQAHSLAPHEPSINSNLGFSYLYHKPQEGIQFFQTALRFAPKFIPAMNGLCAAYALSKQTKSAINACAKATKRDTNSAVPHYFLGAAYLDFGEPEKALRSLKRAARLEPRTAQIYVGLGFAYFKLQENEKALQNFERAHSLNPQIQHALSGMGATYAQMREYHKAEEVLRQALTVRADPIVRYNLGVVCLARKNRDCALSQYNYLKMMGHSLAKPLFNLAFREKILNAATYGKDPGR